MGLALIVTANPVHGAQEDLLFGQRHSYRVAFRGNGEAVVYATVSLINSSDKPIEDMDLEFPRVTPGELVAFQQYHQSSNCLDRPCPLEGKGMDDNSQSSVIYPEQPSYKKLTYKQEGSHYLFKLDKAIASQQSATVVLAYATKGYAKNNFGRYDFRFETLKASGRIATVNVAVDVDSDLMLKSRPSSVNFKQSQDQSASPAALGERNLDAIVSNMGYGAITKQAANLSAGETLQVNGQYSKNWWLLYWSELVIVVMLLAFLALIWLKFGRSAIKKNLFGILLNKPSIVIGLGSAAVIVGLSILVRQWTQYAYTLDPLVAMVGSVATVIVYGVVILGPVVWLIMRGGIRSAVMALIWQLLGYGVFLALYLMLFQPAPPKYYLPMQAEDLNMGENKFE